MFFLSYLIPYYDIYSTLHEFLIFFHILSINDIYLKIKRIYNRSSQRQRQLMKLRIDLTPVDFSYTYMCLLFNGYHIQNIHDKIYVFVPYLSIYPLICLISLPIFSFLFWPLFLMFVFLYLLLLSILIFFLYLFLFLPASNSFRHKFRNSLYNSSWYME